MTTKMMNRKIQLAVRGTKRRAAAHCRKGGSLIEMVVSFAVLIWLSFGMVEFGQYFYIRHAFESAARDGCRVGILSATTQAQVVTAMTNTLAVANITYNSSWLTMKDTTTGGTVTDVSTVPAGDGLQIKLSTTYDQIPNAVRPLNSATGNRCGIKNGKPMVGTCQMIKE